MFTRLWLITIIAVLVAGCSSPYKTAIKYPVQNMTVDLLTLSSDEMEGRETGKAGEKLAAEYIENRFSSLGLRPKGDNNTFFQTFKKIKSTSTC